MAVPEILPPALLEVALAYICDTDNVAHIFIPEDGRIACLAPALINLPRDILEVLAAPWALVTDPQYRTPPAIGICGTCYGYQHDEYLKHGGEVEAP